MIIGIGSDLCDIRRIAETLERFGDRFTHRLFTDLERARSDRKGLPAASYAKRFAAKEACSKALGTGLSGGVFWRDMGGGEPSLRRAPPWRLPAAPPSDLAQITPPGREAVIHLSLTDDHPYAQAFVVIEALLPSERL